MTHLEVAFPGGKKVDIHYKGFHIETDQNGETPTPFDLFLASIASCAGIFALSFCQQRDIPTDGLKLEMHQEFNNETKLLSHLQLKLTVPAEFPMKYESAIVKAMNQCLVKKHLFDPPEFSFVVEGIS